MNFDDEQVEKNTTGWQIRPERLERLEGKNFEIKPYMERRRTVWNNITMAGYFGC